MSLGNQIASMYVSLGADISDFERKMGRAVGVVNRTGTGMIGAGKKLTSAITVPLLVASGLAFKFSSDFESAFAGVKKTVDASEKEFATMRDAILDMSTEIPATAIAIAEVAEAAGQLGIKKDGVLEFTRVMVDLGEATDLVATEGAKQIARFGSVMGSTTSDFKRVGAAIVELGNTSETTESEIVALALRLSGAGAVVGLTQAQVLGFAAAISSVGIEAESGGSAISKTFTTISKAVANGSEDLDTFARVAGVSTEEFSKNFKKDAGGAVASFIEGLKRLRDSGTNVYNVFEKLGISERRQIDALTRLSNAGDKLREKLDTATKSFGVNGSAIATVTEEIKRAMTEGGGSLATFAETAGMTVDEFRKSFEEDTPAALTAFVNGLVQAGASGSDVAEILRTVGIENEAVAKTLTGVSDASGFVTDSLADLSGEWDKTNALTVEANKRYETTASQLAVTRNQFVKTGIAIGDLFKNSVVSSLVPLRGLLELVENLAKKFEYLPAPIRYVTGGLITLVAAVPVLLVALGSLAKAFVAVRTAAVIMGATVRGALIKTGIGAIIVALGVGAEYVIRNWDEVKRFFKNFWVSLILYSATKVDQFLSLVENMLGWIPGAGAKIKAARAKLSNIIDVALVKSQALDFEASQAKIAKAAEEAAAVADEAAVKALMSGELLGEGFDDLGGSAGGAKEIIAQLATSLVEVSNRAAVIGSEFNAAAARVDLLQDALIELRSAGADPASAGLAKLEAQLAAARVEAKKFEQAKIESDIYTKLASDIETFRNQNEVLASALSGTRTESALLEDAIVELIARGSDVASDSFVRLTSRLSELRSTMTDTDSVEFGRRVSERLERMERETKDLRDSQSELGGSFGTTAAEAGVLRDALSDLLTIGLDPADERFGAIATRLKELRSEAGGIIGSETAGGESDIFAKLEADLARLTETAGKTGRSFEVVEHESGLIHTALNDLVKNGVDPTSEAFQKEAERLRTVNAELETLRTKKLSADIVSELDIALDQLNNRSEVLGGTFSANEERVSLFQSALIALLNAGVAPASDLFQKLRDRLLEAQAAAENLTGPEIDAAASNILKELAADTSALAAESAVLGSSVDSEAAMIQLLQGALIDLIALGLDPADERVKALQERLKSFGPDTSTLSGWFAKTKEEAAQWASDISSAIRDGINDAAFAFLEGVGKMAAGKETASGVFKSVLTALADMAIRVGKIAIGTGGAIEGIKKALATLNPVVAIAAGAALIALGSWAKSSLSGAASGGGGGASIPSTATIGNYTPSIPPDSYNSSDQRSPVDRSPSPPSSSKNEESKTFAPQISKAIQIIPKTLPSGDIEYSVREGTRRADRYGTDLI